MPAHAVQRISQLAVLFATVFLALLPVQAAWAHTQLDSSQPAQDETVSGEIDSVVLTFSRPIELLDRSVRVVGSPGRVIDIARSDDGTVVTATIDPPLTNGDHEVAWRILASDSHPREGTVTFTVVDRPLRQSRQGPTARRLPRTPTRHRPQRQPTIPSSRIRWS